MKKAADTEPELDPDFWDPWPTGCTHICTKIVGKDGKPIILGWHTFKILQKKSLVWLATKIGYRTDRSFVGINPAKDYEYLGEFDPAEVGGALLKAFEKKHKIKYTFKE